MLDYQFRWWERRIHGFVMEFIPERELLSCFVSELDAGDYTWLMNDINQVLSGQETYIESDLEIMGVKLRSDISTIYCAIDERDTAEEEVDTRELREAIEVWIREQAVFNEWIKTRTGAFRFPRDVEVLPGHRCNFYWRGKPRNYSLRLGFQPWMPRLSAFLAAVDSRTAYDTLAEDIRKVQAGEADTAERNGAVIGRENTVLVMDSHEEDRGEERLRTEELKAVAAFWITELERYREYVERHGPPEDYRVDAQGCGKAVPPSLCKRLWVKIKRRK